MAILSNAEATQFLNALSDRVTSLPQDSFTEWNSGLPYLCPGPEADDPFPVSQEIAEEMGFTLTDVLETWLHYGHRPKCDCGVAEAPAHLTGEPVVEDQDEELQ
ncbi:MAG: hypothetical protein EXR67_07360 [Dehalococcoidia bacterium]|nr:hypothetical protein [Dehalococcoidia bacterium]